MINKYIQAHVMETEFSILVRIMVCLGLVEDNGVQLNREGDGHNGGLYAVCGVWILYDR